MLDEGREEVMEAEAADTAERGDQEEGAGGFGGVDEEEDDVLLNDDGWC